MIAYAEITVELYCLIANLSSRTVQAQSGLWDGRTASCLLDWLDCEYELSKHVNIATPIWYWELDNHADLHKYEPSSNGLLFV